jgi:NADPH:quinone reductase-like Zn-dependent oxidoreductase
VTASPARPVDDLVQRGEIGGRTVQIVESGAVECVAYEVAPLADGQVRVRTVSSAISPGTEMTYFGKHASNVYLHKRWNPELRIFEAGAPSIEYPLLFGYRAAGEVVESRSPLVAAGHRVFGNWRHTEFTTMPGDQALDQTLPADLSWDDGMDLAQMGPICVNAVLFAEGEHVGAPTVIFGAGPIGLIAAQVARATGAGPVHVVDRIPSRLAIAASLGLEPIEAADGVDVAAMLKRAYGSEAVAVAIECTGSTMALHEAIRTVRRRGLVVAAGFYQGEGRGLLLGDEFHHNGIRISSAQIGNVHPSTDRAALRARTIELVRSGALVLGGLPRSTVPIEQVADAFEALTRPEEVLQVSLTYSTPRATSTGSGGDA